MKLIYRLKLLTLAMFWNVSGQNANPSVGATMNSENNPVDLFTGIPDVGIPIYSMPTRSGDVSINFSLSYNPSSISVFQKRMGNCGSGWNLSVGGVVYREGNDPSFTFNFMGHSGKFFKLFDDAVIRYANGGRVKIDFIKDTQSKVIGFTIYDDRGNSYKFLGKDTTHQYIDGALIPVESAYQLSEIYDSNGNLLVTFHYKLFDNVPVEDGQGGYKYDKINILNKVRIEGYGTVDLAPEGHIVDKDGLWIMYDDLVVKDILGNQIHKSDFDQIFYQDFNNDFALANLIELTQYNGVNGEPLKYKFFYKPEPINYLATPFIGGIDEFGYFAVVDKYFRCGNVDPKNITSGVLEKMTLPTGGCVIYDYEANTYSFEQGEQLDLSNGSLNDGYFFNYMEARNVPNFNRDILGTNFHLDTPTNVFFKFSGEAQQSELIDPIPHLPEYEQPGWVWPFFELWNITSQPGEKLKRFYVSGGSLDKYWENQLNNCLGYCRTLPAGDYSITAPSQGNFPFAQAYKLTPRTDELWRYGRGIRIKAIAYFTDADIPQDYFEQNPLNFTEPSRLITYGYNVFNDLKHSSGYLAYDQEASAETVRYRDVTVYEGKDKGKTEYRFFSPSDQANFPDLDVSSYDFRFGKLISKRVFAEGAATPQMETKYEYTWINVSTYGTPFQQTFGIGVPKKVINLQYFPSHTLQTSDEFLYDPGNYKLIEKKSSTSRSGRSIITKNYYTDHPNNKVDLAKSEQFAGTKLLSRAKIEYLNNWIDYSFTNVTYLPYEMKQSNGSADPEVRSKINRYDRYGHVLETEKQDGIKTSFIWAYNDTQIVAEIANVAYNDIPLTLISDIRTATDSQNPPIPIATALENLRNSPALAGGQLITYTYRPLVGPLTMTDARGYKVSYEYDSNNRQTIVKDNEGNIISENVYHTKPQN